MVLALPHSAGESIVFSNQSIFGQLMFKNKVSESDLYNLNGDEDFARRTNFGLNLGAGYRIGSILVTATYSKGLCNITPTYEGVDDDDDKTTHKGISLAATWFF